MLFLFYLVSVKINTLTSAESRNITLTKSKYHFDKVKISLWQSQNITLTKSKYNCCVYGAKQTTHSRRFRGDITYFNIKKDAVVGVFFV